MNKLPKNLSKYYEVLYWNFLVKKKPSRPRRVQNSDSQLNIILNGPSARDYLLHLLEIPKIDKKVQYMAMNAFATEWNELFNKLMPKYYIAIDPYYMNYKKWLDIIEGVTWNMTLIVCYNFSYKFRNPHIQLYYAAPTEIIRKGFIMQKLHMKNYCSLSTSNVSCTAILEGVRRGFVHIKLYGLDLNDYMNISVDINNHIISKSWKHSYAEKEQKTSDYDLHLFYPRVVDMWSAHINNFNSYYIIEEYARKRGIEIINMNPNSLVDAFEKRMYE